MRNRLRDILDDFEQKKFLYQEFSETSINLIKGLLFNSNIKPHQTTKRVKDKTSLKNKIIRKNYKYEILSEITDLIGIRIITFFEDEIDSIAAIINEEFNIDWENSIDKRETEDDRFGYRSLHYVVSHKPSRTKLTEYKRFKGLKFELQIRSILQHSWAEIEHDIGYKGESEIPKSAKRTFYRVAALLEQADIEFVKLKKEILKFEGDIKNEIESRDSELEITKSNLKVFLKESLELRKVEQFAEQSFCPKGEESIDIDDKLLERLQTLNILKLKQLDSLLAEYGEIAFKKSVEDFAEFFKPDEFLGGGPILWLMTYLESKNDDA